MKNKLYLTISLISLFVSSKVLSSDEIKTSSVDNVNFSYIDVEYEKKYDFSENKKDLFVFFDYRNGKSQHLNDLLFFWNKKNNKSYETYFVPYINEKNKDIQKMYFYRVRLGLNSSVDKDIYNAVLGYKDLSSKDKIIEFFSSFDMPKDYVENKINELDYELLSFLKKMDVIKNDFNVKEEQLPMMIIIDKDRSFKISSDHNPDPISLIAPLVQ